MVLEMHHRFIISFISSFLSFFLSFFLIPFFLSSFLWFREIGSAVLSRVSLLVSKLSRLNLVLTYEIPPEFRGGVHLFV